MIRGFLIYLPALAIGRAASFILLVLGAHLLSPEAFGYFSLVILISESVEMIASNWTRIALFRFAPASVRERMAVALYFRKVGLGTSVVAVVGALAASHVIAPEGGVKVSAACLAYVIALYVFRTALTQLQAGRERRAASITDAGRGLAHLAASASGMWLTQDFFVASIAGSVATVCVGGASLCLQRSERSVRPQMPLGLRLVQFATPIILLTASTQLLTHIDKLIIKTQFDASTLGVYAAAFALGRTVLDVLANGFNTDGFIKVVHLFNEGHVNKASEWLSVQLAMILAALIPSYVALSMASHDIGALFFPEGYANNFATVVPIVGLGAALFNVKNFVFDNVFHLYLKNDWQLVSVLAGAGVAIGATLYLSPLGTLKESAFLYVAGAVASLAISIWLSRRLMRVRVAWRSLAGISAIGGLCLFASLGIDWTLAQSLPLTRLSAHVLIGGLGVCSSLAIVWFFQRNL